MIADSQNHRIRRVDASSGIITTVAGGGCDSVTDFVKLGDDGSAVEACLSTPTGVALDRAGNLLIADSQSHRIRKVELESGLIDTVAGTLRGFSGDGGPAIQARLRVPIEIMVDGAGNLFITDTVNFRIRRVDGISNTIETVAGSGERTILGDGGPATQASLGTPFGLALDTDGNLFIADSSNELIRKVEAGTGIITTVAGTGVFGFSGDSGPATEFRLARPNGLAFTPTGDLLIADSHNNRILKLFLPISFIATQAGNGRFGFSGDGSNSNFASLASPTGVGVDDSGNLFIADRVNHRIRKVDLVEDVGTISTVAGNGEPNFSGDGWLATEASLNFPYDVAFDSQGNLLIADSRNRRIRKVNMETGIITTVAGNGTAEFSGAGGPASEAGLVLPDGVVLDSADNLFIADVLADRIRRVDAVNPPTKRPRLWQCKRNPGRPKARDCRYDRQVEVPYMVRSLGSNHATDRHHLFLIGNRQRGFLQHSSYCCRAQVQTRTRQRLRDLDFAHGWTKGFQSLRRVTHEVREPIDWLAKQQERFRASLVNALRPDITVAGVRRKASAVCWSDQPRAARSSRIASRSVGA